MQEAVLIKRADGLFQAATDYDAEILASLKMGQGYKFKITQGSNRSLQHHRLFFGGLLKLAFQYWQPSGGLVNESEEKFVQRFAQWLDKLSGNTEYPFQEWAYKFIAQTEQSRAAKIGTPPAQSMEHFRTWLTVQAGYFEIVQTPQGIRKIAKSISFAQMSQEEFNAFYQRCFDVVWAMFLNRHFDTPEQAQQAANELLELGR